MNSEHLQRFIDANGILATILPMDEHTPTVQEAARVLGVDTDRIIKSLVFRVYDQPLLVITNGCSRVDRRKLAAYLQVGRKQVKFASPEQALEITGFMVGSMPPFGHLRKLRTIVDESVKRFEEIFGGGGSIDAMMRLRVADLLAVTGAELADLSEDDVERNCS
jgi:Cys-tRNA(Pro) deacylase